MKYRLLATIAALAFAGTIMAQDVVLPAHAPVSKELGALAEKFSKNFEKDRKLAEAIAKEKNIQLERTDKEGRMIAFDRFGADGEMLFMKTDNAGAGRTTSTNKVWPGGSVGTSLTGSGMTNCLGEWDGGAVRGSHQEFGGRVTQTDGATNLEAHGTHVAGTMIASGVDALAKGMAYQATLKAYDWNNDESEMATAANVGMLLSNHSYGLICGWYRNGSVDVWYGNPSISNVEDYKFGFYDDQAKEWDDIANNAPNYLIIKSAGNDRGDTKTASTWQYSSGSAGTGIAPPADGPYDCIAGAGVSKNILTVGAVNKIGTDGGTGWTKKSDVVMSSFSGWGPTDDGRIKPDVVGCGVDLKSSSSGSNSAYEVMSGTSMASPNVTGSLLLVQQHFNLLKKRFMRAATLKALAIHTADEAGNDGPDYTYGWGLVNTAKAVQLITDSTIHLIQESSLVNNTTFSQTISTTGTMPFRVTLCWSDPSGTPVAPVLDPSNRMLVNDLDIRLTRLSDNAVSFPYILNPAQPAQAATTGDNVRDNVEQIYLSAPAAGNYRVTVSHKGSIVGSQPFSLIISGVVGNPAANFQASERTICAGKTVVFTDISGGAPTSRKWYFPGGNTASTTASSVSVTYPTPGVYPVGLRVNNTLGLDSIYMVNYITVGGMTLPFTETFEDTSATSNLWYVLNSPADGYTWEKTTATGIPGNTAYYMHFWDYTPSDRRDGLMSPPLSFKGYASVNLTFDHSYTYDNTFNTGDSLVVYVSTDCPVAGGSASSWVPVARYGAESLRTSAYLATDFVPASGAQWCSTGCKTIDLSLYAGMSNIKLKFEGYNRNNNNLYLDNIKVSGVPFVPVANFYASKSNVCLGETIDLFDSSLNAPSSWKWTFDGAVTNSSSVQNPKVTYNTLGTYAVKLRVTNAAGADSITKTAYINVIPVPAKPTVTSPDPLSFCTGDSTRLSSGIAADAYQWLFNNVVLANGMNQQYTAYNSGQYRVKVYNASGCATASDAVTVAANDTPATPSVTSSLAGNTLCSGSTATLTSSVASNNQWFRNNVALSGAVNKTYTVQDSGSYTVKVFAGLCGSNVSNAKEIQLVPSPGALTITGAANARKNSTEAYTVNDNIGSTYAWTITNGTKTSGGTTHSIQVEWTTAGSGNVKVQETGSNGCKGAEKNLAVTVSFNDGIAETGMFRSLSLFPNPANQFVEVRLESRIRQQATVRMVNLIGQTVSENSWSLAAGSNEKELSLTGMQKGIYFVEISAGEEKVVKRLIIQ